MAPVHHWCSPEPTSGSHSPSRSHCCTGPCAFRPKGRTMCGPRGDSWQGSEGSCEGGGRGNACGPARGRGNACGPARPRRPFWSGASSPRNGFRAQRLASLIQPLVALRCALRDPLHAAPMPRALPEPGPLSSPAPAHPSPSPCPLRPWPVRPQHRYTGRMPGGRGWQPRPCRGRPRQKRYGSRHDCLWGSSDRL